MKEEKVTKKTRVYCNASSFMARGGVIVDLQFDQLKKLYFMEVDENAESGIEKDKLNFAKKHRIKSV